MKRLHMAALAVAVFIDVAPVLSQTRGPATSHPVPIETPPPVLAGPSAQAPVTLTQRGRVYLQSRMQRYIAERTAQLPSADTLLAAGVSAENDAIERAGQANGRRVVAHHIGLASSAAPPSATIDPAVLSSARLAARSRAGREPTTAEVMNEIRAFDDRIAAINDGLAQRRTEIAQGYRTTGKPPRDIEASLLGIAPREPAAATPTAQTRVGIQRLFATLFNELAPDNLTAPTLPSPPTTLRR